MDLFKRCPTCEGDGFVGVPGNRHARKACPDCPSESPGYVPIESEWTVEDLEAVILRAQQIIGSEYDNAGVVLAAIGWLSQKKAEAQRERDLIRERCRSARYSSDPREWAKCLGEILRILGEGGT